MLKKYITTSKEDMIKDQANWFEPKADGFKEFAETTEAWINEATRHIEEATQYNDAVQPSDSISHAIIRAKF